MQLYGAIILNEFATEHPACRAPLAAWQHEVEEATWTDPEQLQQRYPTAEVATSGRAVVFRLLRGYWLGTKVRFERGIVIVERAWTSSVAPKSAGRSKSK